MTLDQIHTIDTKLARLEERVNATLDRVESLEKSVERLTWSILAGCAIVSGQFLFTLLV